MIEREEKFRLRATKWSRKRGLELLAKLDAHFGTTPDAPSAEHTIHEDPEPFDE